jgi:hypothetical protein
MTFRFLQTASIKSSFTTLLAMSLAVGLAVWLTNSSPAAPQQAVADQTKSKTDTKHDASEHAAETAALKLVFAGSTVDLYFDPAEMESGKPGLTGVKFLDHVDVTGKELLRFEKSGGETWLIDPDTVFAFRARKTK